MSHSLTPELRRTGMLIHVDRKAPLVYPRYMKSVAHPELERTGPTSYDLVKIVEYFWLHSGQTADKTIIGHIIYYYLETNRMLESCLGLADGLAIQQLMTIGQYHELFNTKLLFLWRSVIQDLDGKYLVPFLSGNDDSIELDWARLDRPGWKLICPAARFPQ